MKVGNCAAARPASTVLRASAPAVNLMVVIKCGLRMVETSYVSGVPGSDALSGASGPLGWSWLAAPSAGPRLQRRAASQPAILAGGGGFRRALDAAAFASQGDRGGVFLNRRGGIRFSHNSTLRCPVYRSV